MKVDVERGTAREWWEAALYAGEPVFVPAPSENPEDRRVALSLVFDVEAERSSLVVLDGETFAERARAPLPHHVPFGFHGDFFPEITSYHSRKRLKPLMRSASAIGREVSRAVRIDTSSTGFRTWSLLPNYSIAPSNRLRSGSRNRAGRTLRVGR